VLTSEGIEFEIGASTRRNPLCRYTRAKQRTTRARRAAADNFSLHQEFNRREAPPKCNQDSDKV
jgi:hypothetical protein